MATMIQEGYEKLAQSEERRYGAMGTDMERGVPTKVKQWL